MTFHFRRSVYKWYHRVLLTSIFGERYPRLIDGDVDDHGDPNYMIADDYHLLSCAREKCSLENGIWSRSEKTKLRFHVF